MNELTQRQQQGVALPTDNYFKSYGDQAAQRTIIGKLLKFSKGDYLAGEDNSDVPVGTRFIALMDEFMVGYIRWMDNKPTDHVMGRIAEGYQPPNRRELGDDDQSLWERDEQTGELRDPWQFSNYLLLKQVDADNKPLPSDGDDETAHVYTFTASSKGGLGALGTLSQRYGKQMRQHADQWPVIELGVGSYNHKNKQFGRIKVPVLKLVGWVPKAMFTMDEVEGYAEPVAELPLDAPQPPRRTRI